jgi:dTDP-glucose 4,6-dehydratase
MKFLVTGGAGFIGSAFVRRILSDPHNYVLNVDKLTYASDLSTLASVAELDNYSFRRIDIVNLEALQAVFVDFKPDIVVHLAAESHVDRSISGPEMFMKTNLIGTFNLLECSRGLWESLTSDKKQKFRFLHVSTDEVFGDLADSGGFFNEDTAYNPSSPYSASKAGADHLARAWHRSFGLPVMITNCSNNYGKYQFPEKLIPLMTINALFGKPLGIYGDGKQIRDWLYVEDHVDALVAVIERGEVGHTYVIGGQTELENLALVKLICETLNRYVPSHSKPVSDFTSLITFVPDRPGHDRRYGVDCSKIMSRLGWKQSRSFSAGLTETVLWYLDNRSWWMPLINRENESLNHKEID